RCRARLLPGGPPVCRPPSGIGGPFPVIRPPPSRSRDSSSPCLHRHSAPLAHSHRIRFLRPRLPPERADPDNGRPVRCQTGLDPTGGESLGSDAPTHSFAAGKPRPPPAWPDSEDIHRESSRYPTPTPPGSRWQSPGLHGGGSHPNEIETSRRLPTLCTGARG